MAKGPIYEKSFTFALKVVNLAKQLQSEKEFVLSKQMLRSGTAVGALARIIHELKLGRDKLCPYSDVDE
jgi:hypothetical protein